jgi:hypothetical protein
MCEGWRSIEVGSTGASSVDRGIGCLRCNGLAASHMATGLALALHFGDCSEHCVSVVPDELEFDSSVVHKSKGPTMLKKSDSKSSIYKVMLSRAKDK